MAGKLKSQPLLRLFPSERIVVAVGADPVPDIVRTVHDIDRAVGLGDPNGAAILPVAAFVDVLKRVIVQDGIVWI